MKTLVISQEVRNENTGYIVHRVIHRVQDLAQ